MERFHLLEAIRTIQWDGISRIDVESSKTPRSCCHRSAACPVTLFSTCLCPDQRYWVFLFNQKAGKIKTLPTFESFQQFPQTVVNPLCENKTHHICFLSTAGSSFGEALVCT